MAQKRGPAGFGPVILNQGLGTGPPPSLSFPISYGGQGPAEGTLGLSSDVGSSPEGFPLVAPGWSVGSQVGTRPEFPGSPLLPGGTHQHPSPGEGKRLEGASTEASLLLLLRQAQKTPMAVLPGHTSRWQVTLTVTKITSPSLREVAGGGQRAPVWRLSSSSPEGQCDAFAHLSAR